VSPSPKLRKLEIAFDARRELYYDGGLSSVYLWDLDDGGFAGVVLLKKSATSNPASRVPTTKQYIRFPTRRTISRLASGSTSDLVPLSEHAGSPTI
jgi:hypothetical protein